MPSNSGVSNDSSLRRDRYLLLSVSVAGWLSLEYVALGPLSWIYGYGGSLESIPVHLGLARTNGLFSLWTPLVAGGLDRLSFWATADPLNLEAWLFALLPTWLAYGML